MNDRRAFLTSLAAGLALAGRPGWARTRQTAAQPAQQPAGSLLKSVLISMLPKERSYADRFAIARDAGFVGIEMQTFTKPEEAAEIREAAAKSCLRVHSVMNQDHWRLPLSSSDPDVVKHSVAGMECTL